jgi:predicted DNA-binding transcriptional regulator YafY
MNTINTQNRKENKNSGARKRILRLFQMVGMLENANARQKPITTSDLARQLETCRSSVTRDLDFLRDMDIDVEWDKKDQTFIISNNCKYIPAMELSDTDHLLLSFIAQSLAPHAQTPLGAELLAAFHRLFGIFAGTADCNAWMKTLSFRMGQLQPIGHWEIRAFHHVTRAIQNAKVLEFDFEGEAVVLAPHSIVMGKNSTWLVGGLKVPARKPAVFPLAKIENLTVGENFDPVNSNIPERELFRLVEEHE